MASPGLAARLKYLNDSAHLLVTTTTSTSAYLMSRCNKLLFDQALEQTEAQRRHICGACGNILVLGWTGTRQLEALKAPKKKHDTEKMGRSPTHAAKAVVYTCELCSRQTRQHVSSIRRKIPTNITRRSYLYGGIGKHPSISNSSANIASADKMSNSVSANASSKKRAKVRKQGGLQALLAKNKGNDTRGNTGGFGLDLLDFMKKA